MLTSLLNTKKRKEPASTADSPDEIDLPWPKRQKKNNDDIQILAQSRQPLSTDTRSFERNKQQRWRNGRRASISQTPLQAVTVQQPHRRDDQDLAVMLSVLDFSKEAEPRNLGEDTRTLYLKHAISEDDHFKTLETGLRSFEGNGVNPNSPNRPARYNRKSIGFSAEGLRRGNVLDMVGLGPFDLSNVVSPIFRFEVSTGVPVPCTINSY